VIGFETIPDAWVELINTGARQRRALCLLHSCAHRRTTRVDCHSTRCRSGAGNRLRRHRRRRQGTQAHRGRRKQIRLRLEEARCLVQSRCGSALLRAVARRDRRTCSTKAECWPECRTHKCGWCLCLQGYDLQLRCQHRDDILPGVWKAGSRGRRWALRSVSENNLLPFLPNRIGDVEFPVDGLQEGHLVGVDLTDLETRDLAPCASRVVAVLQVL
jgi:hypothetical protein